MHTAIIIDDSKTSRSVLRTILEKNGYEIVAEAANGEEGFEKYCDLHPDFVTLDITMPVLDGIYRRTCLWLQPEHDRYKLCKRCEKYDFCGSDRRSRRNGCPDPSVCKSS